MRPILFGLGPVEVSSYAVMLSLGACAGFWLTWREGERKGSRTADLLSLAALAFVAGLVGGRGLAWALHGAGGGRPWWSVLLVWDQGGMALYGGMALAGVVGLVWMRRHRLPVLDTADTLATAWLPFLAILRVGCFLNGCCYGRPSLHPLAMAAGGFTSNARFGVPSHPAQLYSAAAAFAIFGLLWWRRRRRAFEGELAAIFLALFGAFRFLNDFFRGDMARPPLADGTFVPTFNQWISAAMAASGIAAWILLGLASRRVPGEPDGPPRS